MGLVKAIGQPVAVKEFYVIDDLGECGSGVPKRLDVNNRPL
jgi:hypothetical protein